LRAVQSMQALAPLPAVTEPRPGNNGDQYVQDAAQKRNIGTPEESRGRRRLSQGWDVEVGQRVGTAGLEPAFWR